MPPAILIIHKILQVQVLLQESRKGRVQSPGSCVRPYVSKLDRIPHVGAQSCMDPSCSRRRRTQPRGVSEMGVLGFVFASPGRSLWHGQPAAVPSTLKVSEARLACECGSHVSAQKESEVCVRLQGMGSLDD